MEQGTDISSCKNIFSFMGAKLHSLLFIDIRVSVDDFENNVNSFLSKCYCMAFYGLSLTLMTSLSIYAFNHSHIHILLY